MVESEFWRDLAEKFVDLGDSKGILRARWTRNPSKHTPTFEIVGGDGGLRARFEALARRGGSKLSGHEDPLDRWLDELRKRDINTDRLGGTPSTEHGTIINLCQASEELCHILESDALRKEGEEQHRSDRGSGTTPSPSALPTEEALPRTPPSAKSIDEPTRQVIQEQFGSVANDPLVSKAPPPATRLLGMEIPWEELHGRHESAGSESAIPFQETQTDAAAGDEVAKPTVHNFPAEVRQSPKTQEMLKAEREQRREAAQARWNQDGKSKQVQFAWIHADAGVDHKDAYNWKNGKLPDDSDMSKAIENVLKKESPPPNPNPDSE